MTDVLADAVAGHQARWDAMRAAVRQQRTAPPLQRVPPGGPLPASFAQQSLWLVEQIAGGAVNNLCIAIELSGQLDRQALEDALATLMRRHAVLRTTLQWQGHQLLQLVHEPAAFGLPLTNLCIETVDTAKPDPTAERRDQAHRIAAREAALPFDLSSASCMRARLLRLAIEKHWLLLTFHHLAFDGWSFEVFMGELAALYRSGRDHGAVACPPSVLPDIQVHYADYAAWQRRWMDVASLPSQLSYWKRQLAGPLPVLRLPTDRPRAPVTERRGDVLGFELAPRLSRQLTALAEREGSTLFALLLAAFNVLLYRYTGDEDIIVGTPVAQRNRPELARVVGPLLNTLAVRTDLAGAPAFSRLLARVTATVQDALTHQDLPFEQLIEALDLPRNPDATPLVQVMFTFQNLPASDWSFAGLTSEAWNVHNGSAAFDASLAMWHKAGALGGQLIYDADLFDAAFMQQLFESFRTLLNALAASPATAIDRLPVLPDGSLRALQQWNATASAYPRETGIVDLFDAEAVQNGQATALACRAARTTYAELKARSVALAAVFRELGVDQGALVVLRLPHGPDFVIAALAALRTGAAYVPLAPDEPVGRVMAGLRGARVACVVGVDPNDELARIFETVLLVPDSNGAFQLRATATLRAPRVSPVQRGDAPGKPDALACVMFTSGSTGKPKGVCVPQRGIVRLVKGQNHVRLGRDEVMLQLAPVAFDASTFEIWGALLNGATLAFADVAQPTLADIAVVIRRYRVTTLWLTTGLFDAMVDEQLQALAGLRQLLVGGDVLPVPKAMHFMREVPSCRLVNFYGPTENSTFSTFCELSPALLQHAGNAPIGRPVCNSQVWVLDRHGEPVPPGAPGEAWLGGDGVMLGYLNDAEANEACLRPNPFSARPGALLYRSGDRVRMRRDGQLAFIGRKDSQLKLRGFRVEPGECEQIIAASPLVQAVAVVARPSCHGPQLAAHVVARPGAAEGHALVLALRDHVQGLLPLHLRPAAWMVHTALPLDANGKIDRQTLRSLAADVVAAGKGTDQQRAVAPEGSLEATIAQAFAQILQLPAVDPSMSFFDLGGHSLLALRLLDALEATLQRKVPLAWLFRHSSVAALCAALRDDDSRRNSDAAPDIRSDAMARDLGLVELRQGPPGRALFVVPGGRGGMAEMMLYARLLSHAEPSLAAWGLLAPGIDGTSAPQASVQAMATDFIARVRREQPSGPWLIAGECVGGVIAHEMARQMQAQGDEVALLLLDSWCPTDNGVRHYWQVQLPRTLASERRLLRRAAAADLWDVLRQHVRSRPAFGMRTSVLYAREVVLTLVRVASAWRRKIAQVGKPEPGAEAAHAAGQQYIAAAMAHRPRPSPPDSTLRATLLVTEQNQRLGLTTDWLPLLPGLTVVTTPGDHESYLRETPEATAPRFLTCLARLESDHE